MRVFDYQDARPWVFYPSYLSAPSYGQLILTIPVVIEDLWLSKLFGKGVICVSLLSKTGKEGWDIRDIQLDILPQSER